MPACRRSARGEIGVRRRGHRSGHHHVHARRRNPPRRRFEHVAGDARVLADQHRGCSPAGSFLPRDQGHAGRIAQPHHELGRDRRIADPATHTIGAENLRAPSSPQQLLVRIMTPRAVPCSASRHGPRRERVASGGDVMDPRRYARRSAPRSAPGDAGRKPLADRATGRLAEHGLGRQPRQHRQPADADTRKVAQQPMVVADALAEAKPGSSTMRRAATPPLHGRQRARRGSRSPRRPRRRSADPAASYGAGRACASDARRTRRGNPPRSHRCARNALMSLIMSAPAAASGAHHRRLQGIDRERHFPAPRPRRRRTTRSNSCASGTGRRPAGSTRRRYRASPPLRRSSARSARASARDRSPRRPSRK